MPVEVIGTLKPKNGQSFPIAEAADIEMPDGSRLSDFSAGAYPVLDGVAVLEPDKYYVFGTVTKLSLTLNELADGKAHEYCFEFIPADGFEGLTISPEVSWATPCVFTTGDIHQVSILRGVGVMIRA